MRSARDSDPDPNRAGGLARPPLQDRVRRPFPCGDVPATPSRPPRVFAKSDARVSPLVPASAGGPALSRQPKLLIAKGTRREPDSTHTPLPRLLTVTRT